MVSLRDGFWTAELLNGDENEQLPGRWPYEDAGEWDATRAVMVAHEHQREPA